MKKCNNFDQVLVNGLILTVSSEVMSGIVFNFCRTPSSSDYWQKVCTVFCDNRLGSINGSSTWLTTCNIMPSTEINGGHSTPLCGCQSQIDFASGIGGPTSRLNSQGPGSSELWAFMLYEHVLVILKFVLMGSMSRFSQYINDMMRCHELYSQPHVQQHQQQQQRQKHRAPHPSHLTATAHVT
jgi:hypothetical protein